MIAWAFETLVATTLLMLFVLAIRAPVRRAFGPAVAYALWALPALRMILPPLPDDWHQGSAAPLAQASETLVYYVGDPLGVPAVMNGGGAVASAWPWALGVWAAGALAFAAYHLIAHGRFCARVRRFARSVTTVAAGKVEVIETDAADGPLAFGVWRKYVAFPRDFADRYDPLERDMALAHELGHHARGDLAANWVALLMLAIHWFNPVAWRAFRAFRADQEMACDALVLAGRARVLRLAYARAIVKSAHGGAVSAACHLHTINEIKGRLRMLGVHEKTSRGRWLAGAGSLAVVTLGGLGVTASGTQAAERVRSSVETAVGVELASLELPQAAPAARPTATSATPLAPATRAASAADGDDNARTTRRRVHVIVRDKDGTIHESFSDDEGGTSDKPRKYRVVIRDSDGKAMTREWAMPAMPPIPPMPPETMARLSERLHAAPEVISRNCGDGEGDAKDMTIRSKEGEKRRVIICTNRIERHTEMAARSAEMAAARSVEAMRIQRRATVSALAGLKHARESIESNRSLTETQRSAALSGIDEAIREMESRPNS